MINKIKYYVIHNLETSRYENTTNLLKKYGVDMSDVFYINHPNKDELTFEIKKRAVQRNGSVVATNTT